MDIGFEGGFRCLKRSINTNIHPDWIAEEDGDWVSVAKTGFETVFANDIRPDAKAAWVSYFSSIYDERSCKLGATIHFYCRECKRVNNS